MVLDEYLWGNKGVHVPGWKKLKQGLLTISDLKFSELRGLCSADFLLLEGNLLFPYSEKYNLKKIEFHPDFYISFYILPV